MIKKEDVVTVKSKEYFWCTGNHYSSGEKHNGMYADNKSFDHDSWHKRIDDQCATRNPGGKSLTETPADKKSAHLLTPATLGQKLTLNNKHHNAFCTQAGLSAKAVDCIWEDAQGNDKVQITGGVVQ